MTSSSSQSAGARRPDAPVDLVAAGLLAPLPTRLLAGRDLELLHPQRFLPPGTLPHGPAPLVDRRDVAAALLDSNAAYGHPRVRELAAKLADPATRIVVTGQQPGLFGGPLYSFSKLAAAQRYAEALEAAGTPAMAVFWVATEDHDWAEVSQASFLASPGIASFDLGPDTSTLTPVGMRTFGAAVGVALEELGRLGGAEAALRETLSRWYRPDARFGEAFCRLMVNVFGERCPLLLDAMLPAVKAAEQPHLRRLVERRADVAQALARAEERLRTRGFAPQVEPQPHAGQLFVLQGEARRRVLWEPEEHFSLRGAGGVRPVAELLEAIADNPGVVSPGALSRPALQDAMLGTTLQVLGPGEISYMAQAAALYPVLEIEAPWVALRPQAVVLDGPLRRSLAGSGETLAAILDSSLPIDRLVARRSGPSIVDATRVQVRASLEALRAPATAIDTSLERPWEKTVEQVERALDAFAGKLEAAVGRREATLRGRLERLREACLPSGALQERTLCGAQFYARHGERFATALLDQLGLDPRWLHVIEPDREGSAE